MKRMTFFSLSIAVSFSDPGKRVVLISDQAYKVVEFERENRGLESSGH